MRTTSAALLFLAASALVGGCTTQFYGEPTFPRGARGCWDRCRSEGLEMSAFVYMGEYSSGCVCRVRTTGDVEPPPTPVPAPAPGLAPDAVPPAPPAPDADVQASVAAGMSAVAVMIEQAPTRR